MAVFGIISTCFPCLMPHLPLESVDIGHIYEENGSALEILAVKEHGCPSLLAADLHVFHQLIHNGCSGPQPGPNNQFIRKLLFLCSKYW